MTISDTSSRTSAVGTNTIGQEVAFSFPINATSDLVVKSRVTATGVETPLSETSNYVVTISGDAGGSITMVTVVATTAEIHVRRDTPDTQSLDLQQTGAFSAEAIEEGFDKLTRRLNEQQETLDRCLRAPPTDATGTDMVMDDSISRASTYQTYDSAGNPTFTTTVAVGSLVSGAMGETILATASEAAFKAAVNLEIGTDVQAWDTLLDGVAAVTPTDGVMLVANGTTFVGESGATLQTSIGISNFMQTVIDDADADAAKTTLEIDPAFDEDDVIVHNGSVITHNGNMLIRRN